jgi:PAS domain S-box-containing protein
MEHLPAAVRAFIHSQFIDPKTPAYLLVDPHGNLINWGGELSAYGMTALQSGTPVGRQIPVLEGLFPITELPLALPWIEVDAGQIVDIHLFSQTDEGVWVLILDATPEASMHAILQQRVNALSVLCEQQIKTVEQYRALQHTLEEHAFQGFLIHQDGLIRMANPTLARLFGYDSPAALLGQDLSLLVAPPEEHGYRAKNLLALRQPGAVAERTEWYGRHKDGVPLWLESRTAAASWQGNPAILLVVHDITARKRLEAQLAQAQKMATFGLLTGGIVHDFNNILTAIIGYTELSLSTLPQVERLFTYLQAVLRASQQARDLILQLLAFFRHNTPERQPIRPYYLVKEALTILAAALPSTIVVRQRLERNTGVILANPTQIHQVLLNLCMNAEHAMRHTGGELEITLETVEVDKIMAPATPALPPGTHMRLSVRDTGHGIPPEVIEHIFEPFFTTKQPGEGTGLGLSTAHSIITDHGGHISVNSTPGQGSVFVVYLPCIPTPPTPPETDEDILVSSPSRILFVDDDPTLARLGHETLTRLGHHVVACTGGAEALAAFRATPQYFDLVITDQIMPQMTGVMLAREIRQLRSNIPIILCTGFSPALHPDNAATLGVQAILTKPMQVREIIRVIQRVFAPPPTHAATEPPPLTPCTLEAGGTANPSPP